MTSSHFDLGQAYLIFRADPSITGHFYGILHFSKCAAHLLTLAVGYLYVAEWCVEISRSRVKWENEHMKT
jgi:hypothetical protein